MSTLKADTFQDTNGNGLYPSRAWVKFKGSGTASILGSGNVSTLTDNGTGDYSIAFTNSLSSANYSTTACGNRINGNANESSPNVGFYYSSNYTSSGYRILTYDNNADGRQDCTFVTLTSTG